MVRRRLNMVLTVLLLAGALLVPRPPAVYALAFEVNTTADIALNVATTPRTGICGDADGANGACTLREAMHEINADENTADTITFNIPTSDPNFSNGVWTIRLSSALPIVRSNNNTISGPGTVTLGSSTPQIFLDFQNQGGDSLIIWGSGNTIRNLAIGNSSGVGIRIVDEAPGAPVSLTASNNIIEHSFIGTNAAGTVAAPNATAGIQIDSGADGNIVRTSLVSGNQGGTTPGIRIANLLGSGSTIQDGNQVLNSWIGLASNGTALGNGVAGIDLGLNTTNTLIQGNTISGNGPAGGASTSGYGIRISGSTTADANNRIFGNRIGLSPDGSAARPNQNAGVLITAGRANQIGGLGTGEGNIIAANGQVGAEHPHGIALVGTGVAANQIRGNIIGARGANGPGLPNCKAGILVASGPDTTRIEGNTISANTTAGVQIESFNTTATGPTDGTQLVHNAIGVNQGGTGIIPFPGEITAGCGASGQQTGVLMQGNVVNTTIDGNTIAGNAGDGIRLTDADLPGGSAPGVYSPQGTTMLNNRIGLGSDGSSLLPNSSDGIELITTRTTSVIRALTGTRIGPNNTISGNSGHGILIQGQFVQDTGVFGNRIGANSPGTSDRVNGNDAVRIQGGSRLNVIGGAPPYTGSPIPLGTCDSTPAAPISNAAQYNVIVGGTAPAQAAVQISGSGTISNRVSCNRIGISGSGALIGPASNRPGILVVAPATPNVVGPHNLVANTQRGVEIQGVSTIPITETATTGNAGNGIELTGSPTGNGGLPPPTVATAALDYGTRRLTISNTGCNDCRIEIFDSSASEAGEGPRFLAAGHTSASGELLNAPGGQPGVTLPTGLRRFYTFTATRLDNTSPFSAVFDAGPPPLADIQLVQVSPPDPDPITTNAGTPVVYTYRLTNTGTVAGTYTIVRSSSQPAWVSDTIAGLGAQPIALAAGQSIDFTVTVAPPPGAAGSASDTTTVTAQLTGGSSAARTNTTIVRTLRGVIVEPATPSALQSISSVPGSVVYSHLVRNTGNAGDTIRVTLATGVTPPGGSGITQALLTSISPEVACANPCDLSLGAGASQTIFVRVSAAIGATATQATSTVTGTSQGDTSKTDAETDTTTILVTASPAPQLTLTSPASSTQSVAPGTGVTYTYTLQNSGSASGSFSTAISACPAGFTCTLSDPGQGGTLAVGATRTVSVTVAAAALSPASPDAGTAASITLTATATPGGASTSALSVTTVARARDFSFTALTSPPSSTAPGAPITFEHRLTNLGNAADSYTISASSLPLPSWPAGSFSISPAGTINLARNAQITVQVTVTPPVGTTSGSYTVRVTATPVAGTPPAPAPQNVDNPLTVSGAAVPQLALTAGNPPAANPGGTATFEVTLTNIGNQAGTFRLESAEVPPGWSALSFSAAPAGSPPACTGLPSAISLESAPNNQCRALVTVSVPAGPPAPDAGPYTVRVRAVNTADTNLSATVAAQQTVNPVSAPTLTDPADQSGDPGATVTYQLTLTNNGNFTDTFNVTRSTPAGWPTGLTPASVTLTRNASTTINVTVTLPSGVSAPQNATTTVTVASTVNPSATASQSFTTTLRAVTRGTLSDEPLVGVDPGQQVTITHTVVNTGSQTDAFSVLRTTADSDGFTTTILDGPLNLDPGETGAIRVRVTAPGNALQGTIYQVPLELRGALAGATALDSTTDQVRVGALVAGVLERIGPSPRPGQALPGGTIVYDYRLTNTGANRETFLLRAASSNLNWPTRLQRTSADLGPGESITFQVEVDVPLAALATRDEPPVQPPETTDVTAIANSNPSITATVQDTSRALQFARLTLSPQREITVPANQPVAQVIELRPSLQNAGNGPDTVEITISASNGWPVEIIAPAQPPTPARRLMGVGEVYTVIARVTIPAGTPEGQRALVRITAASTLNGNIVAVLNNSIGTPAPVIVFEPDEFLFLPVIRR